MNSEESLQDLISRAQSNPGEDSWNDLRLWCEDELLDGSIIPPDLGTLYSESFSFAAETLLKLLVIHAAKKDGKVSYKLKSYTFIVLQCFYQFLTKVDEFQDAVEAMPTTQLAKIRFDSHILDTDKDQQEIAIKIVIFLRDNIKKYHDPEAYISRWPQVQKVIQKLEGKLRAEVPLAPRLSSVDRLSVQADYYDVEVDVVRDGFQTNYSKGLDSDDVERRTEIYGQNILPKPPPPSIWIKDFMIIILFIASIGSFAIEEYKAGVTLLIVICVNITIGFVQEYKAEMALNALISMDVPQATVIRNGEQEKVDASTLVPGDVIVLDEGDQVPADLRLFEVSNLTIIEAVLTGESDPIAKKTEPIRSKNPPVGDRKNMAFMTTVVTGGRGKGIVTVIGTRTEAGKIAQSLATAKQPTTPLQKRLSLLGKILVGIALVLCILIVLIGLAWGRNWLELIKLAVSLGVSAIPEGLVAVTTVTMAIGVQRMARKNAIVRKLAAVETLGSVSVICSDKTGTLTEGKMKMVSLWTGSDYYQFDGTSTDLNGKIFQEGVVVSREAISSDFYLTRCLEICVLCNNSVVRVVDGSVETQGDPTEIACMFAACTAGFDKPSMATKEKGAYEFICEHAFDSTRKRMSVAYSSGSELFVFAKGGCESILSICDRLHIKGKERELTIEYQNTIEAKAADMAAEGLRVLALAYKQDSKKNSSKHKSMEFAESKLVFVGLVGIIDPERPEVARAIKTCHEAGILVCMITGDHQSTAKAIAQKLGIATRTSKPLRGVDIDVHASTGTLADLKPWPTVFARVSPENKLQIVQALQSKRMVVAMTGDGVNDSPAIKAANCGVAMGISGTDITKQVASIVLQDDNFETIAKAVQEGRIIYDNIQKFIIYILSCNSAEIFSVLIAICVNGPVPFKTMQILWANIIADVPPAMALGVDPGEPDVMKRPPRASNHQILGVTTGIILLLQALTMSGLCIAALLSAYWVEGYALDHAQSLAFVLLTTLQLFHAFHSRSKRLSIFCMNPVTNYYLILGFLLSFGLLIGSVYIPGVNTFLELVPLTYVNTVFVLYHIPMLYALPWALDWAKIGGALAAHLIIIEFIKVFYRIFKSLRTKKKKRIEFSIEMERRMSMAESDRRRSLIEVARRSSLVDH